MRQNKNQGFTLIEILVVISIIGLLSSIVSATNGTIRVKSKDARRVQDAKSLQTALDLYYADHGIYPVTTQFMAQSFHPNFKDNSWMELEDKLKPYIDLSRFYSPGDRYVYFSDSSRGAAYHCVGEGTGIQAQGSSVHIGDVGYYFIAYLEQPRSPLANWWHTNFPEVSGYKTSGGQITYKPTCP